ncbi:MAG: hypothetical protein Q8P18_10885 [Pseudomonadota bacterium]|nr:hypothetical protein [Pseudomonadota bacterium]
MAAALAFLLGAGLALAAPPSESPAAPDAPSKRVGLEAGLALALPVPPAGLGPGPGLRILGDYAVTPRFSVGGEVYARIPTGARGSLEDEALSEDLDWVAGLSVVAGGARIAYDVLGAADGPRLRVALAGGVAWVALDTDTQVGRTHDAVLTVWVQPEVGALFPLGPGDITADLLVPIAPAELLVLGPAPGGTGIGLAVGYRLRF